MVKSTKDLSLNKPELFFTVMNGITIICFSPTVVRLDISIVDIFDLNFDLWPALHWNETLPNTELKYTIQFAYLMLSLTS